MIDIDDLIESFTDEQLDRLNERLRERRQEVERQNHIALQTHQRIARGQDPKTGRPKS